MFDSLIINQHSPIPLVPQPYSWPPDQFIVLPPTVDQQLRRLQATIYRGWLIRRQLPCEVHLIGLQFTDPTFCLTRPSIIYHMNQGFSLA